MLARFIVCWEIWGWKSRWPLFESSFCCSRCSCCFLNSLLFFSSKNAFCLSSKLPLVFAISSDSLLISGLKLPVLTTIVFLELTHLFISELFVFDIFDLDLEWCNALKRFECSLMEGLNEHCYSCLLVS